MKTLSKEQVLKLHNALLEAFGGTAGVRDVGLLESALMLLLQHSAGSIFTRPYRQKPHNLDSV